MTAGGGAPRVARRRHGDARPTLALDPSIFPSSARHVHDLERMRERLCRTYLDGDFPVPVVWGRATRGRRSMTFGSYDFERRIIRLHPRLDHHDVPGIFVESVLFHELLHHVLGYERRGGRRVVHTARFRALEARYEHAALARRWQKENLHRLLGRAAGPRRPAPRRPSLAQVLSLF